MLYYGFVLNPKRETECELARTARIDDDTEIIIVKYYILYHLYFYSNKRTRLGHSGVGKCSPQPTT